jgi:hypothetical protein
MPDRGLDEFRDVGIVERYDRRQVGVGFAAGRIGAQPDLRQLRVIIARQDTRGGLRLRPNIENDAVALLYLHRLCFPLLRTERSSGVKSRRLDRMRSPEVILSTASGKPAILI